MKLLTSAYPVYAGMSDKDQMKTKTLRCEGGNCRCFTLCLDLNKEMWSILSGDHWNVSARVGRCSLSLPSITGNYYGGCWGSYHTVCALMFTEPKCVLICETVDLCWQMRRSFIHLDDDESVSVSSGNTHWLIIMSLLWNWLFNARIIVWLDSICCL